MKSPNVVMMRDIEAWLHSNIATSDTVFSAALRTWHSCAVADRNDHNNALCQAMHKATVMEFHDILTR